MDLAKSFDPDGGNIEAEASAANSQITPFVVGPAHVDFSTDGNATLAFFNIPVELRENAFFTCWRYETRKDKQGNEQLSKVCKNPRTGGNAKSSDPDTFGTFDEAVEAYDNGDYDGIGSGVLRDRGTHAFIDLDHCINPDTMEVSDLAQYVIDRLEGAYHEISPSGEGLRFAFDATEFVQQFTREEYMNNWYMKRHMERFNGREQVLEVYVSTITNKFVTLTGGSVGDYVWSDYSSGLYDILECYMKKEKQPAYERKTVDKTPNDLSDQTLIAKAIQCDEAFSRLWGGDWQGIYPSQSEADLALMGKLAFWTAKDANRMEHLFGCSALGQRAKWTDREDYRRSTIEAAIASCTATYQPKGRKRKDAITEVVTETRDGLWWLECPYLKVSNDGEHLEEADVAALEWVIEHDREFDGICLEEMSGEMMCDHGVPWDRNSHPYVVDNDFNMLMSYMQRTYRFNGTPITKSMKNLETAFMNVANKRKYNKCIRYLESLPKWDGRPRAATLLVDFLGADNTEYVRTATMLHLHAAVARAYCPGIKYDIMLIVKSSEQGTGKSAMWERLAMDEDLFTDDVTGIGSKEAEEILQGVWIVEIAELAAFKGKQVEKLKAFVSRKRDRYRTAYGKKASFKPRRCVLVGTTNNDAFLEDPTGERRYVPIDCEGKHELDVMTDLTPDYVYQVWAEVMATYDPDKPLILPASVMGEAERMRQSHTVEEPWYGMVEDYLEKTKDVPHCTKELLEKVIGLDNIESGKRTNINRMSNVMSKMKGWTRDSETLTCVEGYGRQKAYIYTG